MKIIWRIIIITIVVGLVLAVLGLSMGASRSIYWDNMRVHIAEDKISRVTELDLGYFKSVNIDIDFSDVEFIIADQYGIDACSYGAEWDWSLEDGMLKITQKGRSSINIINFNWSFQQPENNYLRVYIPSGATLGTVAINTDSGKVKLGDFRADSVQINNSFGAVEVKAITSDNLKIDLDSGDVTVTDLNVRNLFYHNSFGKGRFQTVSAERFTADCDSGDLDLNVCRFGDTVITSSFGKVTTNDLISSRTDVDVDSGDVSLSGEFSGETIIRSDFGRVELSTSKPKEDYSYDISVDFGKITFDNEDRLGLNTTIRSGGVS